MDLNQDQIDQLQSLGIEIKNPPLNIEKNIRNSTLEIRHSKFPVFPLLSISGLTLLSFGGLILLKGNSSKSSMYGQTGVSAPNQTSSDLTPTQVPKSIQHYLLTSQQYFTQATQSQSSCTGDSCGRPTIDLLNQSILAATQAIKEFPDDYRGFYQRGRIYQSILTSKPDLISQVISDLTQAQKLDPTNPEITRSLATVYAKKGDAQNTINYLNLTVSLDPTQAQNFYDLAKIQQQVGLLPQALDTYNRLITLISDPTQKTQIETEKSSLEKIIAQNPNQSSYGQTDVSAPSPTNSALQNLDSPTIQASTGQGLIVAAPEELNKLNVSSLTASNSLSGSSTLPANQKDITLTNTNLISTSQVYVTTTKGGKNQNLKVLSKSNGSFTVGLDSALNEEVEFSWWIVN